MVITRAEAVAAPVWRDKESSRARSTKRLRTEARKQEYSVKPEQGGKKKRDS